MLFKTLVRGNPNIPHSDNACYVFSSFLDIGATGFEGVGEDCRYLAVVTLYPDYFFRKKFAELRETLYLCGVKNKDSQNK